MLDVTTSRCSFGLGLWLAVVLLPANASGADIASSVEQVFTVTYTCKSGQNVVVRYDNTDPAAPTATLEYKGKSFALYNVRSASGARYATEQGLAPDKGLQWWTKGNDAILSEMLMDHTAPEPTPLESCTAQSGT